MTKQRKLVLEIVQNTYAHLTAEEIFLLAKKEMPSIALGTVYRNLNILADDGMIRRLNVPGQPDRFDNTEHEHEHLICRECGRLKDINIPNLGRMIREATGEQILSLDLNAYYMCDECAERQHH